MKRETILYSVIGLFIGALIAGFTAAYAVNNDNQGMMRMMGMGTRSGMMDDGSMSMDDMGGMLKGKTGDEFDKAFIEMMISHHQGAIDMANLAKKNAKHQEIKDLADDILSAQSKEIDMMQTWQGDWGYKDVPRSHDMDMMR